MEIMDKIYNYLGIKENKDLCKKLATNYLLFIILFLIVSVFVKKTTNMDIKITSPVSDRNVNGVIIMKKETPLLTSREEHLVEKLRTKKLNLSPRIKLSDGLL